jgi:hypothetical protein
VVLAVAVVLAACGSGGGQVTTDAASTTSTTSAAPEWVRQIVSRASKFSGGPEHGTADIVEFPSRFDAVHTVMHEDDGHPDGLPVYAVAVRGAEFYGDSAPPGATLPHGRQLTIVISIASRRGMDGGIGPEQPLPGAQHFSF